MDITIPDFMPELRHGVGDQPTDGGCLMQCAAFLDHGGWEDRPECVHDYLNDSGIKVNDAVGDLARRRLALVIPDLLGTDQAYRDLAATWGDNADLVATFWYKRAFTARNLFNSVGVKSCLNCLSSVATAKDPQVAALGYLRALHEAANTVLWTDPDLSAEDHVEYEIVPAPVERQIEYVSIYARIVADFKKATAAPEVKVTAEQWASLREVMTPTPA